MVGKALVLVLMIVLLAQAIVARYREIGRHTFDEEAEACKYDISWIRKKRWEQKAAESVDVFRVRTRNCHRHKLSSWISLDIDESRKCLPSLSFPTNHILIINVASAYRTFCVKEIPRSNLV